jgi:hypothetical protein
MKTQSTPTTQLRHSGLPPIARNLRLRLRRIR